MQSLLRYTRSAKTVCSPITASRLLGMPLDRWCSTRVALPVFEALPNRRGAGGSGNDGPPAPAPRPAGAGSLNQGGDGDVRASAASSSLSMPSVNTTNGSIWPYLPLAFVVGAAIHVAAGGASPVVMAKSVWHGYNSMLQQYPFWTKVATGVTGALIGDALAQACPRILAKIKGQRAPAGPAYDLKRAARFMGYSATVATPIAHFWFLFLDQAIYPNAPTSAAAVVSKMLLDQVLMAPIMTCAFFAAMAAMDGKADQALNIIKSKIKPTMIANYALWPAAHCVNFAFIPGEQRILYINCVAVLWTVFMSTMAASPAPAATANVAQQRGAKGQ